jgi:hypothetical protein
MNFFRIGFLIWGLWWGVQGDGTILPEPGNLKDASLINTPHWEHFTYLLRLKNDIALVSWPDFAREDFTLPALYYTAEGTFAINPNAHILELTNPAPVPSPDPKWKIFRLPESYTDTTEFQFANSYSDDPNDLYYQENIMIFSSFELTRRFVPIEDLDEWAEMVLHELFHAYQRSLPGHREYYRQLSIPGGPDMFLAAYHKDLPWFRESVARENQLLKEIWQNKRPPSEGIASYLELRQARRNRIFQEYGVDIGEAEDYEIMAEGHARYFQSLAKRYMRDHSTDTSMLSEEDHSLIDNIYTGYDPVSDKGLSDIYNHRYYYPLGYNISMILEQYLPGYKETIYASEYNFNTYLEELVQGPQKE